MTLTNTLNEAGTVKIPLTPALSPGRGGLPPGRHGPCESLSSGRGSLLPCWHGSCIGVEVRACPVPRYWGLLWGKMAQTVL